MTRQAWSNADYPVDLLFIESSRHGVGCSLEDRSGAIYHSVYWVADLQPRGRGVVERFHIQAARVGAPAEEAIPKAEGFGVQVTVNAAGDLFASRVGMSRRHCD